MKEGKSFKRLQDTRLFLYWSTYKQPIGITLRMLHLSVLGTPETSILHTVCHLLNLIQRQNANWVWEAEVSSRFTIQFTILYWCNIIFRSLLFGLFLAKDPTTPTINDTFVQRENLCIKWDSLTKREKHSLPWRLKIVAPRFIVDLQPVLVQL